MKIRLPAMDWLQGYQRAWLRADVVAGITLAAYLLHAAEALIAFGREQRQRGIEVMAVEARAGAGGLAGAAGDTRWG